MVRELIRLPLVAVGAVIGALARFFVSIAFARGSLHPDSLDSLSITDSMAAFPWPTLIVNIAGAGAIGALAVLLADRSWAHAFVITGMLGGFTTFSALALESLDLLNAGQWLLALGYLTLTAAGGLIAYTLAARSVRGKTDPEHV